jgi:hypothetical protein
MLLPDDVMAAAVAGAVVVRPVVELPPLIGTWAFMALRPA